MIGAGGVCCPDCGGFTLVPHCNRNGCAGRWCWRAECAWDSPVDCRLEDPPKYPEYVSGRQTLRPVLEPYGVFSNGSLSGRRAIGWQFGDNGRPEWSAQILYNLITTTLDGIRALPGPDTW